MKIPKHIIYLDYLINTVIILYNIFIASMYSIFVPQYCGENKCSLFFSFDEFCFLKKFIFIYNIFSLLYLFYFYVQDYNREWFFIKNLNIDTNVKDKKNNYLSDIKFFNLKLFKLAQHNIIVIVLNFLISLLLLKYYYDEKTILTLICNFILLFSNVYKKLTVYYFAIDNNENQTALSSVNGFTYY